MLKRSHAKFERVVQLNSLAHVTPKHHNSGQKVAEIYAYMAVGMFNEGYSAILITMQLLNLSIGQQCTIFVDIADGKLIERENKHQTFSSKETRTYHRLEQMHL